MINKIKHTPTHTRGLFDQQKQKQHAYLAGESKDGVDKQKYKNEECRRWKNTLCPFYIESLQDIYYYKDIYMYDVCVIMYWRLLQLMIVQIQLHSSEV